MTTRKRNLDITKDVAQGQTTTSSPTDDTDTEDDDNDDDSSGYVNYDEKDDDDDSIDDDDHIIVIDKKEDDDEFVPTDFIFPSYFCFMLWGPFAEKEKQLPMFLLGKNFIFYFSDLIF
jgi:hypothetical protein